MRVLVTPRAPLFCWREYNSHLDCVTAKEKKINSLVQITFHHPWHLFHEFRTSWWEVICIYQSRFKIPSTLMWKCHLDFWQRVVVTWSERYLKCHAWERKQRWSCCPYKLEIERHAPADIFQFQHDSCLLGLHQYETGNCKFLTTLCVGSCKPSCVRASVVSVMYHIKTTTESRWVTSFFLPVCNLFTVKGCLWCPVQNKSWIDEIISTMLSNQLAEAKAKAR